jgi:hypothetical protein
LDSITHCSEFFLESQSISVRRVNRFLLFNMFSHACLCIVVLKFRPIEVNAEEIDADPGAGWVEVIAGERMESSRSAPW